MEIIYHKQDSICITKCPFGNICMVGSQLCKECKHYVRTNGRQSIICNNPGSMVDDGLPEIKWRKAKAGKNFGKDTVVIYDGDPDARLVRCAVYDCKYIHVEDLLNLPVDES